MDSDLERRLTAARHVHGIYSEQAQRLERQKEELYYRVGALIWKLDTTFQYE